MSSSMALAQVTLKGQIQGHSDFKVMSRKGAELGHITFKQ